MFKPACMHCDTILVPEYTSDADGVTYTEGYYCPNRQCPALEEDAA